MPGIKLTINILLLVAAVLLVVIILMQDTKSAGLGSAFGNDTTALGRSRSAKASKETKLQKTTVVLAVIVGVLSLVLLVLH